MVNKQKIVEENMEEDEMKNDKEEDIIQVKASEDVMKKAGLEDLPGVGAATAQKLKEAGFNDLIAIAVASPGEIIEATGISEQVARKMINAARDSLEMGFESGDELLKRRERVIKLKTGSKSFDELLGGGFETSAIVECFGEFGSGKTQIAHLLAVNCQKDDPTAVAVYIDTENTFRPERIKQLAEGAGVDPQKALSNIKVAKAYNSDHQMLLAEKVEDLIKNDKLNVKVLIVDSLTAHFRAEFIGRGTLAERQQKLNKHMHTLLKLSHMNKNMCVCEKQGDGKARHILWGPYTGYWRPHRGACLNIQGLS